MAEQAAQSVVDTTKPKESRTNRTISQSRKSTFIFIWAAGARPPNVTHLSEDKDGSRDRLAHKKEPIYSTPELIPQISFCVTCCSCTITIFHTSQTKYIKPGTTLVSQC